MRKWQFSVSKIHPKNMVRVLFMMKNTQGTWIWNVFLDAKNDKPKSRSKMHFYDEKHQENIQKKGAFLWKFCYSSHCTYVHTHACTQKHMHKGTHAHKKDTYAWTHALMHSNTCMEAHMHTYTHMHTCMHTQMHTCMQNILHAQLPPLCFSQLHFSLTMRSIVDPNGVF